MRSVMNVNFNKGREDPYILSRRDFVHGASVP